MAGFFIAFGIITAGLALGVGVAYLVEWAFWPKTAAAIGQEAPARTRHGGPEESTPGTPAPAKAPLLRLHPDWLAILKHAWSVRLIGIAGLLSGAEAALPLINEAAHKTAAPLLAGLSLIVVSGAFIARFVAQKTLGAS